MTDEGKGKRKSVIGDIENLVEDINKAVRVAVTRTSDAAESAGESLKDTIKETVDGVRSVRDSVVMVRVDKDSLARVDELVEAEVVGSRSEAAAFLIAEGIKARGGLFDKISEKIEKIRDAKDELRRLLEDEEAPPSEKS